MDNNNVGARNKERADEWDSAIGLAMVDGEVPSNDLLEMVKKEI